MKQRSLNAAQIITDTSVIIHRRKRLLYSPSLYGCIDYIIPESIREYYVIFCTNNL